MAAPLLIVGAGIAGACAAFELSRMYDGPVHVFEAGRPAAGASGAAAGLINPLMGRSASPVWRLKETLAATHRLLSDAGAARLLTGNGVLRPAVEPDQVDAFQEAAERFPDLATWLSPAEVEGRAAGVDSCGGGLLIPPGGAVDVAALVRTLLDAARANGAILHTGTRATWWSERPDGTVHLEVETAASDGAKSDGAKSRREIRGSLLLLCVGQGYPAFPELGNLGLKGIKGQTVTVRRPPGAYPLMPVSGRGYIVPGSDDTLILGSSYNHHFDSLDPDPDETEYILEKTSRMLPAVRHAEVLDVTAGVRVKTKATNLPIVGPLPGRARIWTFTALGSKGLLTAPFIARNLPAYLDDPAQIPDDLRVPAPSRSFARSE